MSRFEELLCGLFTKAVLGAVCTSALSLGIYLQTGIGSSCSSFHFLGITLIVFGVVSAVLYCCLQMERQTEETFRMSLGCYIILILAAAGLGIFALVVSSQAGGESIPGTSYKEYHFEWYSKWMQHNFNAHNWNKHDKNVVVKAHVCNKMIYDYQLDTLHDFNKRSLNPFESGCCKPPQECNFNYTNPIFWVKPENGNYTNDDCNRWDNDERYFCFNCDSCKAAFLEDVNHHYFITGIVLVIVTAIAPIVWAYYTFKRCYDYFYDYFYDSGYQSLA